MTELILQAVAAVIGTIAFSVLFGVPKKYYPYCGFIGAAGWLLYLMLTGYAHLSVTESTYLATVLVILLSRFAAVWKKCPATVFLISGIFPLVPGAGIYWTAYYLVMGDMHVAADRGFSAVKAAVAIVLGIVTVFELPNRLFRISRKG